MTQDFGDPGDISFITGVVFDDLNGNNFYDIGEGSSGARIYVEGSAFYAISSTSGAYSVPVTDDGTYVVTFSGGGFAPYATTATATIANGLNVKVDYLVPDPSAAMLIMGPVIVGVIKCRRLAR